jgi:hypothetical protein
VWVERRLDLFRPSVNLRDRLKYQAMEKRFAHGVKLDILLTGESVEDTADDPANGISQQTLEKKLPTLEKSSDRSIISMPEVASVTDVALRLEAAVTVPETKKEASAPIRETLVTKNKFLKVKSDLFADSTAAMSQAEDSARTLAEPEGFIVISQEGGKTCSMATERGVLGKAVEPPSSPECMDIDDSDDDILGTNVPKIGQIAESLIPKASEIQKVQRQNRNNESSAAVFQSTKSAKSASVNILAVLPLKKNPIVNRTLSDIMEKEITAEKSRDVQTKKKTGEQGCNGKKTDKNEIKNSKAGEKENKDKRANEKVVNDNKAGEESKVNEADEKRVEDSKPGEKSMEDRTAGEKKTEDNKTGEKAVKEQTAADNAVKDSEVGEKDKRASDTETKDKTVLEKEVMDKNGSKSVLVKKTGETEMKDKECGEIDKKERETGEKNVRNIKTSENGSKQKQTGDKDNGDKREGEGEKVSVKTYDENVPEDKEIKEMEAQEKECTEGTKAVEKNSLEKKVLEKENTEPISLVKSHNAVRKSIEEIEEIPMENSVSKCGQGKNIDKKAAEKDQNGKKETGKLSLTSKSFQETGLVDKSAESLSNVVRSAVPKDDQSATVRNQVSSAVTKTMSGEEKIKPLASQERKKPVSEEPELRYLPGMLIRSYRRTIDTFLHGVNFYSNFSPGENSNYSLIRGRGGRECFIFNSNEMSRLGARNIHIFLKIRNRYETPPSP